MSELVSDTARHSVCVTPTVSVSLEPGGLNGTGCACSKHHAPENCVIGALSGIGTIGLGEAGRLADELLALVRAWFEQVVRCVTKVRALACVNVKLAIQ